MDCVMLKLFSLIKNTVWEFMQNTDFGINRKKWKCTNKSMPVKRFGSLGLRSLLSK